MPEILLSLILSSSLLLLVVTAQLYTVFEPYIAYRRRTADAVELIMYHSQDKKLHIIAEWWAARLSTPATAWYEEENDDARALKESILEGLVRHRFLFGDDPVKLEYGTRVSPLLTRALMQVQAAMPELAKVNRVMSVKPNVVTVDGNICIWRGRPREYKSRFCDFYPEP